MRGRPGTLITFFKWPRAEPRRLGRGTLESIGLENDAASTNGDFVLRIKGESMIDAGILDGDLVIVRQAQSARNDDIVVRSPATTSRRGGDGEDVLPRGRRVRLQPETASMEPIYARHVQILGAP